jgi:hypothetical protein
LTIQGEDKLSQKSMVKISKTLLDFIAFLFKKFFENLLGGGAGPTVGEMKHFCAFLKKTYF